MHLAQQNRQLKFGKWQFTTRYQTTKHLSLVDSPLYINKGGNYRTTQKCFADGYLSLVSGGLFWGGQFTRLGGHFVNTLKGIEGCA